MKRLELTDGWSLSGYCPAAPLTSEHLPDYENPDPTRTCIHCRNQVLYAQQVNAAGDPIGDMRLVAVTKYVISEEEW